MEWLVYKSDDPATYPKYENPVVLYKKYGEGTITLQVHYYDKERNRFYEDDKGCTWYKAYDECLYSYVQLPDSDES